jgi:hypothetical protein
MLSQEKGTRTEAEGTAAIRSLASLRPLIVVTACTALLPCAASRTREPCAIYASLMVVRERRVKPQVPVPLNGTDLGAAPPPGVTRRIADFAPVVVGLKSTLTVQLPPTATRAGQLCVRANCPGFVPARAIELIGSITLPVLLILTVFAVLVALRATLPKLSEVGETVKVDLTPVPDSVALLVAAPPPAITLSVAILDPVLVGLKTTWIVQLAPGATELPQLVVCANWPGLVPPMAIDVIGKATTAVLRRVIVFALEARFSA